MPPGYFTYRSRTYGVFVFWRGFFKDPKQLDEPVRVMEQTRIYPLGKKDEAKPMEFPDASAVPANMLYPQDGSAFDMLARFIEHEYVDPADMEMRGMAAALGIVKGQPFKPDDKARALLDKAARTASRMGHVVAYTPSPLVKNGLYTRTATGSMPFPATPPSRRRHVRLPRHADRLLHLRLFDQPRHGGEHGECRRQVPLGFTDADGDFLHGGRSYKLNLPKDIPAEIFWSVTVYDPMTGSGLDNGQPFPSLNTMDKPVAERGRLDRHLLRAESPGRRQELAGDGSRQRVLRDLPALRADQGFLRQELEARRHRKGKVRRSLR